MKIVLTSKNESKKRSIEKALKKFKIKDYSIDLIKSKSDVNSRPIGDDTLKGAINRIKNLNKENLEYDLYISIEGGYEQILNKYFIVSYCVIIDKNNNEYIGKSSSLEITEKMYKHVLGNKSLNKEIEKIVNIKDNKKTSGITGYLTNDFYKRDKIEKQSVIAALARMINKNKYDDLNNIL